jgi:hypothetical protein
VDALHTWNRKRARLFVKEADVADKQSAVFGIYSNHAALETAVDALRAKGFRSTDISVLSAQNPDFTSLTPEKNATQGAAAGPGPAAAVGGTLGWLVGMSALAMAGGVFIVAGPVMAALARMGQAAGDIAGALTGFGVPEIEAKQYEGRIVAGGMLLSVHTDDSEWFSQGKHILEQTGADEIMSADMTRAAAPKSPPPGVVAAADRMPHEAADAGART